MRNLMQHPITAAEIETFLEYLAVEINAEGLIGDMRPLLLKTAAAVVRAAHGMIDGIDKRFQDHPGKDHMKWVTPWDRATAIIQAFDAYNPKSPIE